MYCIYCNKILSEKEIQKNGDMCDTHALQFTHEHVAVVSVPQNPDEWPEDMTDIYAEDNYDELNFDR